MRKSKDVQDNLSFLVKSFGLEDTEGADPKIVRMALRSLKQRVMSLQNEFGDDFMDVFRFKARQEDKKRL